MCTRSCWHTGRFNVNWAWDSLRLGWGTNASVIARAVECRMLPSTTTTTSRLPTNISAKKGGAMHLCITGRGCWQAEIATQAAALWRQIWIGSSPNTAFSVDQLRFSFCIHPNRSLPRSVIEKATSTTLPILYRGKNHCYFYLLLSRYFPRCWRRRCRRKDEREIGAQLHGDEDGNYIRLNE